MQKISILQKLLQKISILQKLLQKISVLQKLLQKISILQKLLQKNQDHLRTVKDGMYIEGTRNTLSPKTMAV